MDLSKCFVVAMPSFGGDILVFNLLPRGVHDRNKCAPGENGKQKKTTKMKKPQTIHKRFKNNAMSHSIKQYRKYNNKKMHNNTYIIHMKGINIPRPR